MSLESSEGLNRSRSKFVFGFKLVLFSGLIVGLCVVVVWVFLSRAEWNAKRLISVAEAKWEKEDYFGAIREYEGLIENHPGSVALAEAYYWKGLGTFLYLDDVEEAVSAFKKVIKIEQLQGMSEHGLSARHYLAEIYEKKLNRPADAITAYEDILSAGLDREQTLQSRFKIGELYYDMGEMAQARVEWDWVIEQAPTSPWVPAALYRKGGSYFVMGACEAAVPIYKSLYLDYPGDKNSRFAKFRTANCFEMNKEPAKALALYEELEKNYSDPKMIKQKVKTLRAAIHQSS